MLPEPPEPGSVPSCAEAGVLGVLPGIIGSLQAMEAIKLLLAAGNPPLGKLVHYDALNTSFRNFNLRKDPQCPLCGENPSITELIDYEDFCGVKPPDIMTEITVTELKQKLDAGLDGILIDVRLPAEHAKCSIPSSKLIPLPEIENAASDLPKDKPLYIHCKGGVRSARACTYLAKLGFTQLVNVEGGMDAWLEM